MSSLINFICYLFICLTNLFIINYFSRSRHVRVSYNAFTFDLNIARFASAITCSHQLLFDLNIARISSAFLKILLLSSFLIKFKMYQENSQKTLQQDKINILLDQMKQILQGQSSSSSVCVICMM